MIKYINSLALFLFFVIVGFFFYQFVERSTKTIYVGIDGYLPPFSSTNSLGESKGYGIDIINQIAKSMDMKIEFRIIPFSSLSQSIKNHTVDIILAPFDASDINAHPYTFMSLPYFENYPTFAVRNNRHMNVFTKDNMKGKTICVIDKPQILPLIRANFYYSTISIFRRSSDAFDALIHGKCDAVADSKSSNAYHVTKHKLRRIAIKRIIPNKKPTLYKIAIKKGNKQLVNQINNAIFHLNSTGVINEIHKKWFGINSDIVITERELLDSRIVIKNHVSY